MDHALLSLPRSTDDAHEPEACEQLILNLGCGARTSARCVNIDWSYYLLFRKALWALPLLTPIIGIERSEKLRAMRGKTVYHDLRKGIPYETNSVDAVYHSHLMEHLDRDCVDAFQREIHRVLKPGGIQRICLPDLEVTVRAYIDSVNNDDHSLEYSMRHDAFVADLYEQSVRRASDSIAGKSRQRAWFETLVIGDARKRGETHQWMWDRVNLRAVLSNAGYSDIEFMCWNESRIPAWRDTLLEQDERGMEYKENSLYVECRKLC